MSNQLLGGGEPVNRVCAVRRQERVGGVGFVTPQVIRPESPPQSLKIHRVPPSFPFPRNFQNAQNNFDGRPFLNTPPFLPKFLELRLAMRSIPRRHTGHRALRGAGVLQI